MAVVISERLLDGSDRLLDAEADEQLVSLVQAGHDAAFAAIVRRYERELKAQAGRLTSDGRAEDAVQQAFLNAFAALRGGSEVRHLRGWLHHILRNEVTRARVPLEAPLDATAIYGDTLEDTVQLRATAHATLAHLSALPERQRDALLSTAVLGFPRAHFARTMGLSEGAVRQLVHRARLRLRQAASALIPFPLVKLFGAARSGVDAAPDAALGAGAAASGGLAIKVGALVASGVLATGIAVTHTFPSGHQSSPVLRGHVAHSRAVTHGASPASAPLVAPGNAVAVSSSARLSVHLPAAAGAERRSHGGRGHVVGTHSGRRGGPGASGGRGDVGRGEDGSGSGDRGDSGSRSGPTAGSTSGSGDGAGSGDHGDGLGGSGDGGSVTSSDGGPTQSSSGSASTSPATATTDTSSGGGGGSDGGTTGGIVSGGASSGGASSGTATSGTGTSGGGSSDGGTESSGGSRDVSGSLDSSSS
jgi:RNA polymerase sigma factor (sigma-70 family)